MLKSPFKLAIFAGNDLSTAIMLPKLLGLFSAEQWQVTLYFAKDKPFSKNQSFKLRQFYLYEKLLLKEASKILDEYPIEENAHCFSPHGLSKKFSVLTNEIDNVNQADFLKALESQELNGALSIRCLQIFRPNFINIFDKAYGRFLWNLHSGSLPKCKGAMPLFWTMLNGETQATLSLHEIVPGIDEGKIIDTSTLELNTSQSLLETSCQSVNHGASLIFNSLKKQAAGHIEPTSQNDGPANYYSYPKQTDIDKFEALHLRLYPENVLDMIVNHYSIDGTSLSKKLKTTLLEFERKFEAENRDELSKQSVIANGFFSQQPQKYPLLESNSKSLMDR